ncbi:MAG: hypothetical protein CMF41_06105 [Legionellales bacterium]|nr:hypothetical protein [Legionellales bacterium]
MKNQLSAVRVGLSLGLISALRIFGLMVIVPILSLHASDYHTNYGGVGLAIGIYGLFQAIGQMPFGRLSDQYGRKNVLTFGLLLFALGSFIAAIAQSIHWLILARVLQGIAAVNGVVSAFAVDLVKEEKRPVVLGIIGGMIGVTFFIAICIAPALDRLIGLPGIFTLTGMLSLVAIIWLWSVIPDPTQHLKAPDWKWSIYKQPEFVWCAGSAGIIHGVFTATFSLLPTYVLSCGYVPSDMSYVYGISMLIAAALIVVMMRLLMKDKSHQRESVIWLLLAMSFGLALLMSPNCLILGLGLFIGMFGLLEAILPSVLSQSIESNRRGAYMGGFYAVAQFGVFILSAFAGTMRTHASFSMVLAMLAFIIGIWATSKFVYDMRLKLNESYNV